MENERLEMRLDPIILNILNIHSFYLLIDGFLSDWRHED